MRSLFSFACLTILLAVAGEVQAQGTITGQVVDGRTLRGLAAVQISIPGLGVGALTNEQGRYILINVPAGAHTVQASRIGYQGTNAQVTVASGASVQQNFEMNEQALALDEIVVTGTAGGSQRRAVGNVVGRVNAAEIADQASVTGVEQLLTGREPGAAVLSSGGNVGAGGGGIRIRGHSSATMGNQPLIYIDGIRMDNNAYAGPRAHGGAMMSVFDDLNPNDIESIEIIKGPAAATLYGTEASAGVINVRTKRGHIGTTSFDVTVRQGAQWLQNPRGRIPDGIARNPQTGEIVTFNLWEQENAAGRNPFQTGQVQAYNLAVRGGTDRVRYFVSGDWDREEGYVDYNWSNGLGLRSNLNVILGEDWNTDISVGYLSGETSLAQQRDAYGLWEQLMWSNPLTVNGPTRGYLRATPEAIATIEAIRQYSRFTAGFTISHNPREWFTHRGVVGIDRGDDNSWQYIPRHPDGTRHFFGSLSLGHKEQWRPTTTYNTFDYGATVSLPINDNLRTQTSAGFQFYRKHLQEIYVFATNFAAPEVRTLSAAANRPAEERIVENTTVGVYLQQEAHINNRIFLTGAVRGDDNSAFGSNYDAAIYPKFSATWVVSEEPFWRLPLVNSLRLRTAWGRAGQQPDAFAAVRLYQPETGPGGAGIVTPKEIGNPDLGPEVGTELEGGFDATLFGERLTTVFTYYTQKTKDAILAVANSPSTGFSGSQRVNIGEISNWGWELSLDGTVVQTRNVNFGLGFNVARNQNRIDDMGGVLSGTFKEGFGFPAIWGRHIHRDPETGKPTAEINPLTGAAINVRCDGGTGVNGLEIGGAPVPCANAPQLYTGRATPEWDASFTPSLALGQNLRLSALVDIRYNYVVNERGLATNYGFGTCEPCVMTPAEKAADWDAIIWQASMTTAQVQRWGSDVDQSFAKLRDLSAVYSLSPSVSERFGASRASVQLGIRNLPEFWRKTPTDPWGRRIATSDTRRTGDEMETQNRANLPGATGLIMTVRASF
jgi:TonB-dependent SusC/RagA subfamily outer membrane receptor